MSRSWHEKPTDTKSVKRWARWHRHNDTKEIEIKDPDKHLHSHARKRKREDRFAEYLKG